MCQKRFRLSQDDSVITQRYNTNISTIFTIFTSSDKIILATKPTIVIKCFVAVANTTQ